MGLQELEGDDRLLIQTHALKADHETEISILRRRVEETLGMSPKREAWFFLLDGPRFGPIYNPRPHKFRPRPVLLVIITTNWKKKNCNVLYDKKKWFFLYKKPVDFFFLKIIQKKIIWNKFKANYNHFLYILLIHTLILHLYHMDILLDL